MALAISSLDAVHFERNLAEEDDVGTQAAAAGAAADLGQAGVDGVVFDGRAAALALAAGFGQFAVHVDQATRAGALVQVVHVLGAEKEAVADALLKLGQRDVRGIGLGLCCRRRGARSRTAHTSAGLRSQASGVQTSSMRLPAHRPSSARKVGRPLSALMPAPVRTKTRSVGEMEIVVMSSLAQL